MAIQQEPLGHGQILWLGINFIQGEFSHPQNEVVILHDGIENDMYRGMWREISAHDVDYIATDSVNKGDLVRNHRQITIIQAQEVRSAGALAGVNIGPGMLRENMVVTYQPMDARMTLSKLPPLSRMVIGHGDAKILDLNEENGPCKTICHLIARHFGRDLDWAKRLRKEWLQGRRGQMASVRSAQLRTVRIGDPFRILPPMGWPYEY